MKRSLLLSILLFCSVPCFGAAASAASSSSSEISIFLEGWFAQQGLITRYGAFDTIFIK
jgi:hypothetical protein